MYGIGSETNGNHPIRIRSRTNHGMTLKGVSPVFFAAVRLSVAMTTSAARSATATFLAYPFNRDEPQRFSCYCAPFTLTEVRSEAEWKG